MPDICAQQAPARWTLPHIAQPSLSLFALLLSLSLWPPVTRAEIRVVTAQGEHRMGDRDTREDAIRLATEAAKQQALEEVAVYLESVTVVNNMDVTKDEIRTYTAGLVLVLEQNTDLRIDGDAIVVKTYLVAQIDTDEVSHAIKALRENEDAKHQLSPCGRKTINSSKTSTRRIRPWPRPRPQSRHSRRPSNDRTS